MMTYEEIELALIEKFGLPIGRGRNRVVFYDEITDTVVKAPMRDAGCFGNEHEARTSSSKYEPRAAARLDERLSAEFGRPILRMEYVKHTGWSKEPDWTWSVDCGQVGVTRDGRLVAYDWERY